MDDNLIQGLGIRIANDAITIAQQSSTISTLTAENARLQGLLDAVPEVTE